MNVFFILTYLLIGLSMVSLIMAEIVNPPLFLLVVLLVAISPFRQRLGLVFSKRTVNLVVLATLLFQLWNIIYNYGDYVRSLLTFSLILLIAKLYAPKNYRDHIQIFLITAFYLLASTIKLASLGFLGVLMTYLALGIAYLILLNLRRDALWAESSLPPWKRSQLKTIHEKDFGMTRGFDSVLGWKFFSRMLAFFLFILVFSTIGFFTIPRFTWRFFAGTSEDILELETGFSENVDLGELGQLKLNTRPVMKVKVIHGDSRKTDRVSLRWRGITLDEFDGSSWKVSQAIKQAGEMYFLGEHWTEIDKSEWNLEMKFEVRPINTRMVFSIPEVTELSLKRLTPNRAPPRNLRSVFKQNMSDNLLFTPVNSERFNGLRKLWSQENPRGDSQRSQRRRQGWLSGSERVRRTSRPGRPFYDADIQRRQNQRRRARRSNGENQAAFFANFSETSAGFKQKFSYLLRSRTRTPNEDQLRQSDRQEDPSEIREIYLQLPKEAINRELIRKMAWDLVGDAPTRYDRAQIVDQHLRNTYEYSLTPVPGLQKMSLESFLFDIKKGHCEYFSAAMAVMLRTLDIPCRIVNGFLANEYNGFGEFYQVRQSDAHSWVEVFFPGQGWVTFDPTPPLPASGFSLGVMLSQMATVVEGYWLQYVVDYSFNEQKRMFGNLYSFLRPNKNLGGFNFAFSPQSSSQGNSGRLANLFLLLLILIVVAAGWFLIKKSRRKSPALARIPKTRRSEDIRSMIKFYEQLLLLLKKQGFERMAGQTPGELALKVALKAPTLGEPVGELTEQYYAVRFGEQSLSSERKTRVQQLLKQLKGK